MLFKTAVRLYVFFLICLAIFSYGFVDLNFPFKAPFYFHHSVPSLRIISVIGFLVFVLGLFGFYSWVLKQVKKKQFTSKQIWQLIFLSAAILFFSWPGLSYDIFNYMATAKVAFFYRENPYLVMPIEFPGEPMLEFMHAANKIALYAPFWIMLTAIPHFLGFGHLLLTVFTFKALVFVFYLGSAWLIWKLSDQDPFSLTFFALNPLLMFETLISAHNDVVMMFFGLLAFSFLFQKKRVFSALSWLASVGIKYATLVLGPLFLLNSKLKKEKLFSLAAWLLLGVFLLSPLREEIYSWYLIWFLSFVALAPKNKILFWLAMGFSLGLLLRYLPFLYTRNWGGITPLAKNLATFIPAGLSLVFAVIRKKG